MIITLPIRHLTGTHEPNAIHMHSWNVMRTYNDWLRSPKARPRPTNIRTLGDPRAATQVRVIIRHGKHKIHPIHNHVDIYIPTMRKVDEIALLTLTLTTISLCPPPPPSPPVPF